MLKKLWIKFGCQLLRCILCQYKKEHLLCFYCPCRDIGSPYKKWSAKKVPVERR